MLLSINQPATSAPIKASTRSPQMPRSVLVITPANQPAAMPMVDVVSQLDQKAAANSQKLNWKTSIVDLLKLLDLDSSLAARKELATELNVRAGADGSAEQNMALHKAVLAKIAANGGNVPKELLD